MTRCAVSFRAPDRVKPVVGRYVEYAVGVDDPGVDRGVALDPGQLILLFPVREDHDLPAIGCEEHLAIGPQRLAPDRLLEVLVPVELSRPGVEAEDEAVIIGGVDQPLADRDTAAGPAEVPVAGAEPVAFFALRGHEDDRCVIRHCWRGVPRDRGVRVWLSLLRAVLQLAADVAVLRRVDAVECPRTHTAL